MNTDIRISVGLTSHPKTVKLMRRCGDRSFFSLISLWTWAAQYRPDGILTGLDREDIEISAGWQGEAGKFSNELINLRFIDDHEGTYFLHDWSDHNSWAAKAEERGDIARFSRLARTNPELFEKLKSQGISSISKEEYDRLTTNVQRTKNERKTNVEQESTNRTTPAPAPAPSPAPSPKDLKGKEGESLFTEPPVDNSPKTPFFKNSENQSQDTRKEAALSKLKEVIEKLSEIHKDQHYIRQIILFVEANIRSSHPDAITHVLESLSKASGDVKFPRKYLDQALSIENGKYHARDHETNSASFRASTQEAAQAMASIGDMLKRFGVNRSEANA